MKYNKCAMFKTILQFSQLSGTCEEFCSPGQEKYHQGRMFPFFLTIINFRVRSLIKLGKSDQKSFLVFC